MAEDVIERIERDFKERYRKKKLLNLIISAIIVVLGVTSVIFIWNYDRDGILTFRWMTVDGTTFTTVMSIFYIVVNIFEFAKYTELTSRLVYFTRLASAVAESLIMVVVLISQLPMFPEHMHIFRYDMFNMHILIPLLTVTSFAVNDSPIGKLSPARIWHGTWFITIYGVTVLSLIITGAIPSGKIPYFFLDVENMPAILLVGCFLLIYALGYLLSMALSKANRSLSWKWFRNIARKDRRKA